MKHNHIKMIRLYNNNNNANHYHFGWLWHHFREKVRNQIEVCPKSRQGLSGQITIIRLGPFKPMSVWSPGDWVIATLWLRCPCPGDGWQPVTAISRHPWHRSRAPGAIRSASQYPRCVQCTVQLYRPGMTLQWLYSLPWDTEPWTRYKLCDLILRCNSRCDNKVMGKISPMKISYRIYHRYVKTTSFIAIMFFLE